MPHTSRANAKPCCRGSTASDVVVAACGNPFARNQQVCSPRGPLQINAPPPQTRGVLHLLAPRRAAAHPSSPAIARIHMAMGSRRRPPPAQRRAGLPSSPHPRTRPLPHELHTPQPAPGCVARAHTVGSLIFIFRSPRIGSTIIHP